MSHTVCAEGLVDTNFYFSLLSIETMLHNLYVLIFHHLLWKINQFGKKWSTMFMKHMKYGEMNTSTWNVHFRKRTQFWKLFNLNMLVTSAVGCFCSKLHLLVIWDLMTANKHRFLIHGSLFSTIQVICVNSLPKYVGLQQVWEAIREWTRLMSIPNTGLLYITYAVNGL